MAHDVIISYATVDKPTADAVCAKLEDRGIRCWIAPRDILPGADYAASIIGAIDSAKIMVLIFSSNANASKHVMREAERAVQGGYPIIPFRIEDVEPSPSLQYCISGQHWLDALTPPLEQHILKLADTISILLGKQAPPTREPPPQPPEKRCTQCGAVNRPNATFCAACGVPFASRPREGGTYEPPAEPPPRETPPPLGPWPPSITYRPSRRTLVLSAVIVLVAISAIAAAYYVTHQGAGDTVTYQNPQIGVKFTYPQNWIVVTDPTYNGTYAGRYYEIDGPAYSVSNPVQVNFWKQYKQGWLGDNDDSTTLNKINADIHYWYTMDSNVIVIQNATPTTLGGVPAYKVTVSCNLNKNPNTPHMVTRWYTTNGDYVYNIGYENSQANFNATLNTAEQIVNSFKFT